MGGARPRDRACSCSARAARRTRRRPPTPSPPCAAPSGDRRVARRRPGRRVAPLLARQTALERRIRARRCAAAARAIRWRRPPASSALTAGAGRRGPARARSTPTARSSRSPWPVAGPGCTGSGRCAPPTTCSTGSPSPSPGCCDPTCPAAVCAAARDPAARQRRPGGRRAAAARCPSSPAGRWSSCPPGRCRTCRGRCCRRARDGRSPSRPRRRCGSPPGPAPPTPGHTVVAAGPALPGADGEARAVAAVHGVTPVLAADATAEPGAARDRRRRPRAPGRARPPRPAQPAVLASCPRRRAAVRLRHRAARRRPAHGGARGVRERAVRGVCRRRAARARRDVPRPRREPARGVPAAGPGRRDRSAHDRLPPAARRRPAGRRGTGPGPAAAARGRHPGRRGRAGSSASGRGSGARRCATAAGRSGCRRSSADARGRSSAAARASRSPDRPRVLTATAATPTTAAPVRRRADQQAAPGDGQRAATVATVVDGVRDVAERREPEPRALGLRAPAARRAGRRRPARCRGRPPPGRAPRRPDGSTTARPTASRASRGLTSAATPSATRDAASARPPSAPARRAPPGPLPPSARGLGPRALRQRHPARPPAARSPRSTRQEGHLHGPTRQESGLPDTRVGVLPKIVSCVEQ